MPTRQKPAAKRGGPTGPRKGSRPYLLLNLKPGERAVFMAPPSGASKLMQQIWADVARNGLGGKIRQSLVIGVEVSSREVIDMVLVTRLQDEAEAA